jgi:hypothetical protein
VLVPDDRYLSLEKYIKIAYLSGLYPIELT